LWKATEKATFISFPFKKKFNRLNKFGILVAEKKMVENHTSRKNKSQKPKKEWKAQISLLIKGGSTI
jgi:hypothetical protein